MAGRGSLQQKNCARQYNWWGEEVCSEEVNSRRCGWLGGVNICSKKVGTCRFNWSRGGELESLQELTLDIATGCEVANCAGRFGTSHF